MDRIVVIGAGIAGTAAALALRQAGFGVEVHEAHPSGGADPGAFLTLADTGMLALRQLGVDRVGGFPLTAMRVVDATGAEVAAAPLRDYRCLRRAELCAALREEAERRGIEVRTGSRCTGVDGAVARFADGRVVRGDLLIAADGVNSALRAVIDPAARKRYAGQRVYYGYTDRIAPPHEPGRIEMLRGGRTAFGYAVSPSGVVHWFARLPVPAASPDADLLAALRPDATPAARIVEATDEVLSTDAHDLAGSSRWRLGRGLLVGDAAHAAAPATGKGASMALEDAVVLAKALRDAPDPDTALDRYERHRRPRVERNVLASARMSAGPHAERPAEVARLAERCAGFPEVDDAALAGSLSWPDRLD
ncbi:FAD-dependent oxidoreductase [Saccharopolyspora sp. CA-218241]|uniref:FAD-dependent oxidoreductase n=1 Tax=Saccharopolyspora sp. CA-218241 TaxID=3240027 RepID=UPI003D98F1E7